MVGEYNIRNVPIELLISTYIKSWLGIVVALTVFHILTFQICDVENIGQNHDIDLQHSQAVMPLDGKYMSSYLLEMVLFGSIAINLRDICK